MNQLQRYLKRFSNVVLPFALLLSPPLIAVVEAGGVRSLPVIAEQVIDENGIPLRESEITIGLSGTGFQPLQRAWAQAINEGTGQPAQAPKAQSSGDNPVVSAGPSSHKEPPSDSGKMSDKEKAEVYMALAKLAYEQFDRLADIAWRLRFAVWTSFGLATWFVLASDKWRPRRMECVLASLITLGLIATVVFIWGPYQYERSTRWILVAEYWESAVEHTVGGEKLPDRLRRASLGTPWYKQPVYVSNALVTAFFGLLVIGAIVSRTDWRSGSANKKPPHKGANGAR